MIYDYSSGWSSDEARTLATWLAHLCLYLSFPVMVAGFIFQIRETAGDFQRGLQTISLAATVIIAIFGYGYAVDFLDSELTAVSSDIHVRVDRALNACNLKLLLRSELTRDEKMAILDGSAGEGEKSWLGRFFDWASEKWEALSISEFNAYLVEELSRMLKKILIFVGFGFRHVLNSMRFYLLRLFVVLSPLLLSLFMIPATRGVAVKFLLTTAGFLLWSIAACFADLVILELGDVFAAMIIGKAIGAAGTTAVTLSTLAGSATAVVSAPVLISFLLPLIIGVCLLHLGMPLAVITLFRGGNPVSAMIGSAAYGALAASSTFQRNGGRVMAAGGGRNGGQNGGHHAAPGKPIDEQPGQLAAPISETGTPESARMQFPEMPTPDKQWSSATPPGKPYSSQMGTANQTAQPAFNMCFGPDDESFRTDSRDTATGEALKCSDASLPSVSTSQAFSSGPGRATTEPPAAAQSNGENPVDSPDSTIEGNAPGRPPEQVDTTPLDAPDGWTWPGSPPSRPGPESIASTPISAGFDATESADANGVNSSMANIPSPDGSPAMRAEIENSPSTMPPFSPYPGTDFTPESEPKQSGTPASHSTSPAGSNDFTTPNVTGKSVPDAISDAASSEPVLSQGLPGRSAIMIGHVGGEDEPGPVATDSPVSDYGWERGVDNPNETPENMDSVR
jgi:hypothetical protein